MLLLKISLALLLCSAGATWSAEEWRILALRVDFPLEEPDEPTTTGRGKFDLRHFLEARPGYSAPYDTPPHDSTYFANHLQALSRYYSKVSEGRVEIEFAVFPHGRNNAYTLPRPALSYATGRSEEEIGSQWGQLFRDAVELADADALGPRFAEFNSFLIFHAGAGYETGELNDIRSVYLDSLDLSRFLGGPLLVDDGQFAIRDGWILPEARSQNGRAGLNGLLARFFGHQLGLPGLSNFADGQPALGTWSLMDVGSNAGGYVLQDSLILTVGFAPPHPMAWSKARLGWIEPVMVERDTTLVLAATDLQGVDLPKAVRIPISTTEYFLLENRQQRGNRGIPPGVGESSLREDMVWLEPEKIEFSRADEAGVWLGVEAYDAFVPGSGILVWHVDDAVIEDRIAAGAINNDPVRQGIALEEADGYRDIGQATFARLGEIEGTPRDPFFVGGRTVFAPETRPDSRSNAGAATGIRVEVLSSPGDSMRVGISFERARRGWPLPLARGERLQGADVEGDGEVDLLVESARGVGLARAEEGFAPWFLEGADILAAADADADGRVEIFVARGGEVSAWRAEGQEALWSRALEGNPATGLFTANLDLFPGRAVLALGAGGLVLLDAQTGAVLQRRNVGVHALGAADADGDGAVELVLAGGEGLWRLRPDGLEKLRDTRGEALLAPASGDLDGDGAYEIVSSTTAGALQVWSARGEVFARDLADSIGAAPILGDVDGDGLLEIVALGAHRIHALRGNGILQADFPLQLARFEEAGRLQGSAVLVDLDGGGGQEILAGTGNGIYGFGGESAPLAAFPLLTAGPVRFTPLGADLDGDGGMELAALAGEALYLWEPQRFTPAYEGGLAGWGQYGFSAAGTRAHPPLAAPVDTVSDKQALLPRERVYCYPNPVEDGGDAHLRFFLSRPARLDLEVFDAIGGRVDRLQRNADAPIQGESEFTWSTRNYASGLYLCRLEARDPDGGREVAVVKMAVRR